MRVSLSGKTWIILGLIVLIILLIVVPIEKLGKPSISGAAISKVFARPLETNNTCNINLVEGWNLVAISCVPDNVSASSVLGPIINNYTSIHTYNTTSSDNWKSFNPHLPSWVVKDLDEIKDGRGYWIKVNNYSELPLNGTISTPNSFSLFTGWNLIGYPSTDPDKPSDAFASVDGSYSIVWTYNTSTDTYLYYNPTLGSGTISNITNDRGYWINMTQNDTLVIT